MREEEKEAEEEQEERKRPSSQVYTCDDNYGTEMASIFCVLIAAHKCQTSRGDSSESRSRERKASIVIFVIALATLPPLPLRPQTGSSNEEGSALLSVVDFETTDTRCRVRSRGNAQERACETRNKHAERTFGGAVTDKTRLDLGQ